MHRFAKTASYSCKTIMQTKSEQDFKITLSENMHPLRSHSSTPLGYLGTKRK